MIEKIILFTIIILLNISIVVIYRKFYLKRKLKPLLKLQALFDKGMYTEAITAAEKMLATPLKPLVYEFIGNCYFELDKREESIRAYEKALSLDDDLEFSYIGLGKLRLFDNKVEEAIIDFKKALKIDSRNTVAKYYSALAYEQKGDHEAAITELTEAKETNPTVMAIYEKLEDIYVYLNRKSDADKIREMIRLLKGSSN